MQRLNFRTQQLRFIAVLLNGGKLLLHASQCVAGVVQPRSFFGEMIGIECIFRGNGFEQRLRGGFAELPKFAFGITVLLQIAFE
ncbi:MAG: hypothetical protein R3C19_21755 [Planctomycetaceae bacterium]